MTERSGYLAEDTIAALTTPLGGAIAMVRISGPQALSALSQLSGRARDEISPRELRRVRLRDSSDQSLDDAMAVYFAAPRSFTGEDCVELHLHGSHAVARLVLESLRVLGVRQALPGEFSFRAVRNGRMDLFQAQGVADLIAASNERAARMALEKTEGGQSRELRDLAETLRQAAAMGELGLDFSDQDVEELSLSSLQQRVRAIIDRLQRLSESFARGSRIQDGVSVAFVGLPNAGKSSLFNAFIGEDRSIVSEIAGTTRDVVREHLNLRGSLGQVTLRLEDTAGLRKATDAIERIGVERTRQSAERADLVILVMASDSSPDDVHELVAQWQAVGVPIDRALGVVTKCDLADLDPKRECGPELASLQWHRTSAISGHGVAEAARAIADRCEQWFTRAPGEIVLTRQAQVDAVIAAIADLERALSAHEMDLFASDVAHALHSLSPLIGQTVPDDLLGRIFSQFCIGK